ncbi:MAG: hypothetical protein J6A94_07540 [Lachnospiraceae bacterium]|nr:hypothetical protein [Lachnospiraceae bacterium]
MFQEEYRSAYHNICPGSDSVEKILARAEHIIKKETRWENKVERQKKIFYVMRPVVVSLLVVLLCAKTVLPVAAAHIPGVYHMIEKYVPGLMDFILPEEISSTSKGITMQVEAIEIVDNTAEVLISFRDAEKSDGDLIRGKIDLYDSYHIRNLDEQWAAGGCHFLEYDEAEDKAYFKIDLSSSDAYEKSRINFAVNQILTKSVKEERKIDLSHLEYDPKEKRVSLSGIGGMEERSVFPFWESDNEDDPRPGCRVMDVVTLNESMREDLVITGVAYDEGVLRVQSCRGDFADADRHIRPYLKDAEGNEIPNDCSVGWQEEINGENVLFDEHWFLISEEELEKYELYAMFYITEGSVKGNWNVNFKLE